MTDYYEICEAAVKRVGAGHQIIKAMEELGELTQALAKLLNGEPVTGDVCEEIADVEIMIEQLKIIIGPEYEMYMLRKKEEKMKRLEEILEGFNFFEGRGLQDNKGEG